ncbi:MAG: PspC domain-containing protein [Saprospiraceae bacterium]|nr:PspC domain-containing protein [Saprospiraceae bacterium]
MNKTININLGGFPFTIDDTAFELLERYMTSIKNHFAQSDSYQEIISDIEIRLGELLHEKTTSKAIVSTADIESVIKIMGRPEEFGAESIDLPGEDFSNSDEGNNKDQKTRKLFRDRSNKYVGGVCSGLAAYLGIKNANWVRLAFIIFTTSGGFGIPLYIIMWIFVPEAKTSSDFLAMKGKRVTVSNIAAYMEKEINNFSSQVSELSDDISKRFSAKGNKSFRAESTLADMESAFKSGTSHLGRILKPFGLILGGFLLLTFAFVWITSFVGYILAFPLFGFINSSSSIINFLLTINSFVIMIVPLVFIIFWALRLIFRTNVMRSIRQSLVVFWISNLICFIILSASTFREFKNYGVYESKQNLENLTSEIISIEAINNDHSQGNIELGDLRLGKNDQLEVENDIDINIIPTTSPYWHYTKKVKSRGKDGKNAKDNADCIQYALLTPDDHTLQFPTYLTIDKDCKYRFQQVEIDLYIPIGKSVTISEDLKWNLTNVTYDQNQMKDGWKMISGKSYKMTEKGLYCTDCTPEELAVNMEPNYYQYVSTDEIPNNAILQSNESAQTFDVTQGSIWNLSFDKIMVVQNNTWKFNDIKLNVDLSPDDKVHIIRKLKFYGTNPVNQNELDHIYNFRVSGQDITMSNYGYIQNGKQIINPKLEISLLLPRGLKIHIDDTMNDYKGQVNYDKSIEGGWNFVRSELLQMDTDGLKCLNCE